MFRRFFVLLFAYVCYQCCVGRAANFMPASGVSLLADKSFLDRRHTAGIHSHTTWAAGGADGKLTSCESIFTSTSMATGFLCIHFFCRPVTCGIYNDVNGTALAQILRAQVTRFPHWSPLSLQSGPVQKWLQSKRCVRQTTRTGVMHRHQHLQTRLHGHRYFRIHSFGRERRREFMRREVTEGGFIATHIAHSCASHAGYMLQEVSGRHSPSQKSRTMGSELQRG